MVGLQTLRWRMVGEKDRVVPYYLHFLLSQGGKGEESSPSFRKIGHMLKKKREERDGFF